LPLSITADNSTSGALTVNGNLSTTGTLDVNGGEIILDSDADTSITSDTDDQIDFKIGGTDVATLTNSHLVLKGTTPKITIGDGGEEDTALIFNGNAQDFYIGLDDSADDLVIGTGSTVGSNPKVVVENGGNVGIGEASPLGLLHVKSGESSGSADSNADELVIEGSGNHGIQFLGANNSFMQLLFGDSDDSDVGYLAYDHTNNVLSFGVNAGEKLRIQSGGGISFNGDSATANALDDYEEGSFDPHIYSGATNSILLNNAGQGRYVKIGRFIYVTIQIFQNSVPSTVTSGSGNYIALPFVSAGVTTGDLNASDFRPMYYNGMGTIVAGYLSSNTNKMFLSTSQSNILANLAGATTIGGSVRFYGNIVYFTRD